MLITLGERTEETQNEFRAAYGVCTRKESFLVAIFHSTAKVCKTSAKSKIDYISRENKYSHSTKAEDLIYFESNNLPKWAKTAREFFSEMDKQELSKEEKEYNSLSIQERKEKDKELKENGTTINKKVKCREIEFSLPIELESKENYIQFAKEYCKEIMGDNHVYAFAIHENKGAISGNKNPHVHLLYSDRIIERDREVARENFCKQRTGYKKDMDIVGSKRNEWIEKNRKILANKINNFLKSKNINDRVDHRSFKKRGIEQKPTIHLGNDLVSSLKKSKISPRTSTVLKKYKESYKERYQAFAEQEIAKKEKLVKVPMIKRAKAGFNLLIRSAYDFKSDRDKKIWVHQQKEIFNDSKLNQIKNSIYDEMDRKYKADITMKFKNLTSDDDGRYLTYNKSQSDEYERRREIKRQEQQEQQAREEEQARQAEERAKFELDSRVKAVVEEPISKQVRQTEEQPKFEPDRMVRVVVEEPISEQATQAEKQPKFELEQAKPEWPTASQRKPRGSRLTFSTSGYSTYSDGLISYNQKYYEMKDFKVLKVEHNIIDDRYHIQTPIGKIDVPGKAYKKSQQLEHNNDRGFER